VKIQEASAQHGEEAWEKTFSGRGPRRKKRERDSNVSRAVQKEIRNAYPTDGDEHKSGTSTPKRGESSSRPASIRGTLSRGIPLPSRRNFTVFPELRGWGKKYNEVKDPTFGMRQPFSRKKDRSQAKTNWEHFPPKKSLRIAGGP